MKLKVLNAYTEKEEIINVSILKWLLAGTFAMKVDERKYEGWSGYNPFYLFYCEKHRIWIIDYPHGYDFVLWCPKCLEEK
jgi:hypothetical protein